MVRPITTDDLDSHAANEAEHRELHESRLGKLEDRMTAAETGYAELRATMRTLAGVTVILVPVLTAAIVILAAHIFPPPVASASTRAQIERSAP